MASKAATACSSSSAFDVAPSSSPSRASLAPDPPGRIGCAPWLFSLRERAEPMPTDAPIMTKRVLNTHGKCPQGTQFSGMSWFAGCTGYFRRAGSNAKCLSLDAQQHAAENHAMQRRHAVPVEQPEQPARLEEGDLLQSTLTPIECFNAEFEQCFPGQFHFCP